MVQMIFLFKKGDFQVSALNFWGDGVFVLSPKKRTTVGGGNSNIFYVHPDPWGFMIQFDDSAYFWKMGWFNHHLEKVLRKIQQIPGTDPRYPKIQIWQDFLHQQVVEGLGYVPGVCWSFLRKVRFLLLFQMPPPVGEIFFFLEVSARR